MITKKIAVLPGDGIGPEVTAAALNILRDVCRKHDVQIETTEYLFGGASIDENSVPVTDETLEACKAADAVLLGAVGGPKWDDQPADTRPEKGLLALRKELGVFANLRPVKAYEPLLDSSPLRKDIVQGTDILIVRELTGGIYFGKPQYTDEEGGEKFAVDTLRYSESEIKRVTEKAFDAAVKRRGAVCSVDKSNVLTSSRLWRETVTEYAKSRDEVELSHMLVDNAAMQIIRDPSQFDVIVTGNMFGDILSDEASMLTGSLGMLPSASLGEGPGLYEPVHGSAPDIAGQGVANPLGAIASAAMLCRHSLDLVEAADAIEQAIETALADGLRTRDIYTGASGEILQNTDEISEVILQHISPEMQHS